MTRLGLRVPPGFALSLEAYKDFMSLTGAAGEITDYINRVAHGFESIEHFNDASVALRGIVEAKALPQEMEDLILSHYREMCQRCNTIDVAVSTRSAGAASHPGQYETHLNVIGEADLINNIRKVWASTFNPRSLSARKWAGAPLETDPIGVAVVKMVHARSAGVLFTADPNTGDTSRMIIEANWGLGESVVGGEAMPDVYILDKDTLGIVEKKMGAKGRCVVFRDMGVAEEETPDERKCCFCLSDEEASEIGRLGKMLEAHFGIPQDTEWAVDGERTCPDSIVLLQTRAEVVVRKKKPVDQVLDMMLNRFGR
jgi:pyruvate,water dikinase